jgi:TetR/AcrR family transcriptional repressor of nem operon
MDKYKTFGKICGCPYCCVGSELSTQDEKIRLKAEDMAERMIRYIVGFVRAAQAEGRIAKEDPSLLAQQVNDFVAGLLIRAKIENNPEALERLKPGVLRLLGWKPAVAEAVAG